MNLLFADKHKNTVDFDLYQHIRELSTVFEKFCSSLSAIGKLFLNGLFSFHPCAVFPTACYVFMQTKTPHKTIACLVRGLSSSFT